MKDPEIWHAYVDNQLTPDEKCQCESMLKESHDCQSKVISIEALKNFTKANTHELMCQVTWKTCCGRIHELERTTRAERFIGRYAWGICGVLFASILGGGIINRLNGGARVDSAAFMQNLTTLGGPNGTDRAAQNAWVNEVLGQARDVVKANNIRVLSVETGNLEGVPTRKFELRDNSGPLCLLVTDSDIAVEGMEAVEGRADYLHTKFGNETCVRWRMSGKTFFLIGNRPTHDLVSTAERLKP